MGGGGKGGGGGASVPQFVVDAQSEIADRSQQLFNATQPALQQGAPQLASLLSTGGVGARVPIIQNAERAQQGAFSNAQRALSQISNRGGVPPQFANRAASQLARQGERAVGAIGPNIAAPTALAGIESALTGGRSASQGFQAGLSALAAGRRVPTPSASRAAAGGRITNSLGALFGQGGFFPVGGGKGGGQSAFLQGASVPAGGNVFTNFGASAPGIQLEF